MTAGVTWRALTFRWAPGWNRPELMPAWVQPRSRLHARGQVTGRGSTRLVVRFDGEDQTVSLRPHLVRVRPAEAEMPPLSVEHIIEQLRDLLPATRDGHVQGSEARE